MDIHHMSGLVQAHRNILLQLGVAGVVIIAHGKSDPLAIANVIKRAKESVERGLVAAIGAVEGTVDERG